MANRDDRTPEAKDNNLLGIDTDIVKLFFYRFYKLHFPVSLPIKLPDPILSDRNSRNKKKTLSESKGKSDRVFAFSFYEFRSIHASNKARAAAASTQGTARGTTQGS